MHPKSTVRKYDGEEVGLVLGMVLLHRICVAQQPTTPQQGWTNYGRIFSGKPGDEYLLAWKDYPQSIFVPLEIRTHT
jgi:hypothetical protein